MNQHRYRMLQLKKGAEMNIVKIARYRNEPKWVRKHMLKIIINKAKEELSNL